LHIDNKKYIYIRSLLLLGIFILIHYLYKWFPNIVFSLFSPIDESVYQHFKNAFYSYIILTLIEYAIFGRKLENKQDKSKFFFSHMLSAIIISWFIFIFFLTLGMFFGERYFVVEIIYAQTVVYISGISISIFEDEFKNLEFSKRFKGLIIVLFIYLVVEFTVFTFNLPWHDVFANPYA